MESLRKLLPEPSDLPLVVGIESETIIPLLNGIMTTRLCLGRAHLQEMGEGPFNKRDINALEGSPKD